MKLKYIFAVGVMALLASCDESRFLDIKLRVHSMTICYHRPMV